MTIANTTVTANAIEKLKKEAKILDPQAKAVSVWDGWIYLYSDRKCIASNSKACVDAYPIGDYDLFFLWCSDNPAIEGKTFNID